MDLEICQCFAADFPIIELAVNQVRNSILNARFDRFGYQRIIRVLRTMRDFGDELRGPAVALSANELRKPYQFPFAKRAKKPASFEVSGHFSFHSQEIFSVMPKGFSLADGVLVEDLHDSLYQVFIELHWPDLDIHFAGDSQGSPCLLGYVVALPILIAGNTDRCHVVPPHDIVELRLCCRETLQKGEYVDLNSGTLDLLQELVRMVHILIEFFFEPANSQNATAHND
jgi:hypothetical protein